MANPNPSNKFKKGDPRAVEAAKKSRQTREKKVDPKRADALEMLKRFQDRSDDAFAALDELLEKGDIAAVREVLNRTMPEALAAKLIDADTAKLIEGLQEENAELRRRLAEYEPAAVQVA